MQVSDAILSKRAIRDFATRPLADEQIRAILNAGRRAQSSKNEQAWRFIAVTERPTLEALSHCGQWAGHLAGAALGVAILTPDPAAKFQRMFDAGQAAAYMQLASWELGIGSCPASIYDEGKARQILGYPQDWHLRVALSFGYPRDPAMLREPSRRGGRIDLSEVVHFERW